MDPLSYSLPISHSPWIQDPTIYLVTVSPVTRMFWDLHTYLVPMSPLLGILQEWSTCKDKLLILSTIILGIKVLRTIVGLSNFKGSSYYQTAISRKIPKLPVDKTLFYHISMAPINCYGDSTTNNKVHSWYTRLPGKL